MRLVNKPEAEAREDAKRLAEKTGLPTYCRVVREGKFVGWFEVGVVKPEVVRAERKAA